MSSGRLPSLKDAARDAFNGPNMKKKTALKFKPKAGTRRSKEEREASALKVKSEVPIERKDNKNANQQNRTGNQRQRRVPRYLANTHVISSGPLAAGNFVGDNGRGGGTMMRRGFVKVEGDGSSLVKKGLLTIENDANESDLDEDGDYKKVMEEEDDGSKSRVAKFNMGREYRVGRDDLELDENSVDSDIELDEEALQARRIEELFPVRPLRVRHEDIDLLKKDIQESLTETTTREPTPGVMTDEAFPMSSSSSIDKKMGSDGHTLIDTLENKRDELQDKLNKLNIDSEYEPFDAKDMKIETIQINRDHEKLRHKLQKINNKSNKFVLFQLPYTLPTFQDVTPKNEENGTANSETTTVKKQTEDNNQKEEEEENKTKKPVTKKTKNKKSKKKIMAIPQEELRGKIGALRIHKSGKMTVRIGEVVMEVSRGAETSFIQDLVALNIDDEEIPTVEYLGRVDDRILVTPNFL